MPCNHCSFETSFTFEQGWTSDQTQRWGPGGHVHDGFGSGTDGRIQDGIDDFGDWAAASGAVDQVTVEANYGGGAGGRGYRHVRGNGSNNNGSGMTIRFPRTTEIWLRFYSRFKSGFRWSNGVPPGYAKEIYFKNDTSSVLIVDWLDGFLSLVSGGSNAYRSSQSYSGLWGNPSNGSWHCIETHIRPVGGAVQFWVDGVNTLDVSGVSISHRDFSAFTLGSNQSLVTGGDHYTDYDDVAVSATRRIGCL